MSDVEVLCKLLLRIANVKRMFRHATRSAETAWTLKQGEIHYVDLVPITGALVKIALDYDNTYSADPEFWQIFAHSADLSGHEVRIVTVRDERHDRTQPLIDLERILPVIYTRGVAKQWYCLHHSDGFIPDIWIDDKPESILRNSAATPEGLVEWRLTRGEVLP